MPQPTILATSAAAMTDSLDYEELELILRCREAFDVARTVMDVMMRDLTIVSEDTRIYAFKHRLKPVGSILAKVKRKRVEGVALQAKFEDLLESLDAERASEREKIKDQVRRLMGYSSDLVTDSFGCRYVTLFPQQIPEVVNALFNRMHDFNEKSATPVKLREIIVYTNRRREDSFNIALPVRKAYEDTPFAKSAAAEGVDIRDDESKISAYSSVHVTFEVNLLVDHAGRQPRRQETGSFEVQIRDIFEEGWGEIDHYVSYSGKDKADHAQDFDEDREELRKSLLRLKTNVMACGTAADDVHAKYRRIKPPNAPSLTSTSATRREDDRDAIIAALHTQTKAKQSQIDAVRTAYDKLVAAEKDTSHDGAIKAYHEAEEEFKRAMDLLQPFLSERLPSRGNRPISYFLRMELANCYLFGEAGDKLKEANAIFEEVQKEFPGDPVVRVRRARTMTSIDQTLDTYDNAIELLREADKLINGDSLTGPGHWIRITLHAQLSFSLWSRAKLAKKAGENNDWARFMNEAAKAALRGYQSWKEMPHEVRNDVRYRQSAHRSLSNLLFFAAELIENDIENDLVNKQNLQKWIVDLENIGADKYRDYYKTEDNLMRAHKALGNEDEARALAECVYADLKGVAELRAARQLNLGEIPKMLDAGEIGPFRAAVKVLTGTS